MVGMISRTLFLFATFVAFLVAMVGLGVIVFLATYYTLISIS